MKKCLGFVMVLITLAVPAFGQDTLWTRNYGFAGFSEQCMGGCLTSDGGFAMTGYTTSITGGDAWIVRADYSGDTVWTRHYGGDRWQEPHYIMQTDDGGFVLTGKFNVAAGDYRVGIIRLSPSGDSLWGGMFGTPGQQNGGNMVIELSDGNFLAVGEGRNGASTDMYMVKFDTTGSLIWQRFHGSSYSDYAHGVVELPDGGFAVTGSFSTSASSNMWLVRTDSSGTSIWARQYDFHGDLDRGDNIVIADNGDFVIGGRTWNGGRAQLVGLRVDSLGNQIWASEFGVLGDGEFAESIDKTLDGGFVIGGGKGYTTFDFYVVRLNSDGDSLWAAVYNGATGRSDDCYEIRVNDDGDILALGYTDIASAAPSDLQFWAVKIDDGAYQGGGDPEIDVTPLAFADTVGLDSTITLDLYIANTGTASLRYGIHGDQTWIASVPDTGIVPMAGIDTVSVVLGAIGLTPGTYNGQIDINSNDTSESVITLPVTLLVRGGGGCVYLPGDINGNGTPNGIDVGYGVNYFKGGPVPPIRCDMCPQPSPFFAGGDVNGNCVFNGIDVTFFVNYLKGIVPALLYCPSCPPAM